MSENVKIKINEYDNTSPASRSTDSTDVAFVPGFSEKVDAPKNTPTLCRTVSEFEQYFGKYPLKFNVSSSYTNYGFKTIEVDRSYVYAKELLQQGMPVVYTNVCEDTYFELPNTEESVVCKYKTDASYLSGTVSKNTLKIVILKSIDVSPAAYIQITTNHTIPPKSSILFEIDVRDIKMTSSESDATVYIDKTEAITYASDTAGISLENVSDSNKITISNTTSQEISASVVTTIPFCIKGYKDDYFTANLYCPADTILDLFYSSEANQNKIQDQFDLISDKSLYSVKYITCGGYPSALKKSDGTLDITLANKMIECAKTRGDAVALIDYQKDETAKVFDLEDSTSYYHMMSDAFDGNDDGTFGAAMYPWAIYRCTASNISALEMPASFGYLMCVAKAIRTSPNWLAMAGVTRGIVPNITKLLTPLNVLSNKDAEELQPKYGKAASDNSCSQRISINCITNIQPYGLTLWGNRTLKPLAPEKGTTALNFLNTRNMLSDIKKVLYTTGKSLMFEQNSDTLWLRFKNSITPLLNQLKSGNGISDYKIIKGETKYDGSALTKGEMSAIIRVYPLYAVEYFELNVEISDEDVTVS